MPCFAGAGRADWSSGKNGSAILAPAALTEVAFYSLQRCLARAVRRRVCAHAARLRSSFSRTFAIEARCVFAPMLSRLGHLPVAHVRLRRAISGLVVPVSIISSAPPTRRGCSIPLNRRSSISSAGHTPAAACFVDVGQLSALCDGAGASMGRATGKVGFPIEPHPVTHARLGLQPHASASAGGPGAAAHAMPTAN